MKSIWGYRFCANFQLDIFLKFRMSITCIFKEQLFWKKLINRPSFIYLIFPEGKNMWHTCVLSQSNYVLLGCTYVEDPKDLENETD